MQEKNESGFCVTCYSLWCVETPTYVTSSTYICWRSKDSCYQKCEDTKGVTRIRKSKKNRQHNGQKKKEQNFKQRSTKHSTKRPSNTSPTENWSELRKGGQFLFHMWHQSYYPCYISGEKSWTWTRKGSDCYYDERNISVAIREEIFRNGEPRSQCCDRKTFEAMTSTQPLGTLCSVAILLGAIPY